VRVFANAVKGQMEAYEITAELRSLDEKKAAVRSRPARSIIEVKLANGVLSIKGEKQEDKKEKENAASARSSVAFRCPRASIPTKSRSALRMGYCR
jgi:hypothetical protein